MNRRSRRRAVAIGIACMAVMALGAVHADAGTPADPSEMFALWNPAGSCP